MIRKILEDGNFIKLNQNQTQNQNQTMQQKQVQQQKTFMQQPPQQGQDNSTFRVAHGSDVSPDAYDVFFPVVDVCDFHVVL